MDGEVAVSAALSEREKARQFTVFSSRSYFERPQCSALNAHFTKRAVGINFDWWVLSEFKFGLCSELGGAPGAPSGSAKMLSRQCKSTTSNTLLVSY